MTDCKLVRKTARMTAKIEVGDIEEEKSGCLQKVRTLFSAFRKRIRGRGSARFEYQGLVRGQRGPIRLPFHTQALNDTAGLSTWF